MSSNLAIGGDAAGLSTEMMRGAYRHCGVVKPINDGDELDLGVVSRSTTTSLAFSLRICANTASRIDNDCLLGDGREDPPYRSHSNGSLSSLPRHTNSIVIDFLTGHH